MAEHGITQTSCVKYMHDKGWHCCMHLSFHAANMQTWVGMCQSVCF
jgi:hypothetical protein